MINWLHHLFSPHCEHCRAERQENSICQTCEVLTVQLARSNVEKDNLLAQIERMANPPVSDEVPSEIPEPLKPRVVPWNVQRNLMEAEDRHKAKLMRDVLAKVKDENKDPEKSIEELEREVGILDGEGSKTV